MAVSPTATDNRRWRTAQYSILAILFFALAESMRWLLFQMPGFRAFYLAHPWQVGETVWKVLWIVIALAGIWTAHRGNLRDAFRELGLMRSPVVALVAALSATLPLLLVFAVTLRVNPAVALLPVWMTVIVSPVAEEVLIRGYLFRQLHSRGRWPFWLAVLMNAAPFIWGHLYQANPIPSSGDGIPIGCVYNGDRSCGVLVGVCALGLQPLVSDWPAQRHESLVVSFQRRRVCLGGWAGNLARAITLGLAIVITLRCDALGDWFRRGSGRGAG